MIRFYNLLSASDKYIVIFVNYVYVKCTLYKDEQIDIYIGSKRELERSDSVPSPERSGCGLPDARTRPCPH